MQAADARTLVTLLHVRDILKQVGRGDAGGERDARRPQPGARVGRRRRRRRGQRRDRQPAGHPALRGPAARAGVQGAARQRGQRDLPAPGRVVRPARRRGQLRHRWSPARPGAARPRSASSRRSLAHDGAHFGVVVNPAKSQHLTISAGDAVVVWPRTAWLVPWRRTPETLSHAAPGARAARRRSPRRAPTAAGRAPSTGRSRRCGGPTRRRTTTSSSTSERRPASRRTCPGR